MQVCSILKDIFIDTTDGNLDVTFAVVFHLWLFFLEKKGGPLQWPCRHFIKGP